MSMVDLDGLVRKGREKDLKTDALLQGQRKEIKMVRDYRHLDEDSTERSKDSDYDAFLNGKADGSIQGSYAEWHAGNEYAKRVAETQDLLGGNDLIDSEFDPQR